MQYKQKKKSDLNIDNHFGISDDLLQILLNRGINTDEKIEQFLRPSFDGLLNPYLFSNMELVVKKINDAIYTKRKIVIYGDYDVDGIMATSSLFLALKSIGADVCYYVPNRHTEGYGLNKIAIDKIYDKFPNALIITVDCGITSVDEVNYINSFGTMEVIVTDHHNPKKELPNCLIIDAKVDTEKYPFKELCGTGVVAKIIHAICGINYVMKFLDLIAIATVADVVPLIGENRIFVTKGLEFMNKIKRPGIQGLIDYAEAQGEELTESYHLGFRYGPLINACGRLGSAYDAIRLMTTSDPVLIKNLSEKLKEYNEKRKEIEKDILEECINILGEGPRKSIVLWNDSWEAGVIGIVASRLVEKYHCPSILFTYDNKKGIYSGSGRSIENINLFNTINKCSSLLLSFGGHDVAAGLKIEKEKLNDFSLMFSKECNQYEDNIFEEVIEYDAIVNVSSLNKKFYDDLRLLQPCGMGNPNVKLYIKNISLKNAIVRGKKAEHFSGVIYDATGSCDAICFNKKMPDYFDNIDIICSLTSNNFKGNATVSCNIISYKKSDILLQREAASQYTNYGTRVFEQPIEILGINNKKIDQFKKNGIETIQDLLNYLPKKYYDYRYPKNVDEISNMPETCAIVGTVKKLKSGDKMSYAMCIDENGKTFMASWFYQDYVIRMLNIGYKYIFCGRAIRQDNGFVQIYPSSFSYDIDKFKRIIPEYKKIKGMSSDYLKECIDKALQLIANTDFLDKNIVDEFSLVSDYDATNKLHNPKNDFDIRDGQRRKVFNDLFKFNFILKEKNFDNVISPFLLKDRSIWDKLRELLPYKLTNDQDKCLEGIYEYMNSSRVLNALVQGDVGSGKTMIGLFSMVLAANNGYQSCIIAPTEVLANQHYKEISGYAEQLGYKVGYLSGSIKAREKKDILNKLKDGSLDMVVGTHAVLQDTVEFNNLAVVVIDEQHRFGVRQREKLSEFKGPHMISMSATPIPRTLSMAIYGDNIQVYNIKEKPAGRKDVITLRKDSDNEINQFMLEQIRQGRQCYIVCPLIEESEAESMTDVHSVKTEVDNLLAYFKQYPEIKISNTTGRMKKELIAEEIDKFIKNETNILVSTTIIEVGVNVPNATVMVLKSSERFGLAQAHQLRGRVGRGLYQSYCLLQPNGDDPKADILCNNNDGFEIAKQDMLLRGSGDYIGTQQTGKNNNVMLMMSEPELYKKISELNDKIYKDPVLFAKYKYILEEEKEKEREAGI